MESENTNRECVCYLYNGALGNEQKRKVGDRVLDSSQQGRARDRPLFNVSGGAQTA